MNNIPLKVEIKTIEDIAVIKLAANFYTSNTMAQNLKTALNQLFEQGIVKIIINMKEVTSIDSEGLGVLTFGYKHCLNNQGKFIICELINRDVSDVVEIVNLDKIVSIINTEAEAIEKIKTP